MKECGVAIVDDDDDFLLTMVELVELSPELVVVGTAATPTSGLALLCDEQVQLGLVDVGMPGGGGPALIAAARRARVDARLVLISAMPIRPAEALLHELETSFIAKCDLDLPTIARLARSIE